MLASSDGIEVRDLGLDLNVSIVIAEQGKKYGYENALFAFAYIADYFGGDNFEKQNISYARTVPLLVLPSSRLNNPSWVTAMAVAPSHFHDPRRVPGPTNNAQYEVDTFADLQLTPIAARHVKLAAAATEADFVACVVALRAALPGVASGRFVYDAEGYWSPTYAFFYGEAEETNFDIECWVSIKDTASTATPDTANV